MSSSTWEAAQWSQRPREATTDYFQASGKLFWFSRAINCSPAEIRPAVSDSSASLSLRLMTQKWLVRRWRQSHSEMGVESRQRKQMYSATKLGLIFNCPGFVTDIATIKSGLSSSAFHTYAVLTTVHLSSLILLYLLPSLLVVLSSSVNTFLLPTAC